MHIKTIVFGVTLCLATLTKAAPTPQDVVVLHEDGILGNGLLGSVGDAVDDVLNDLLGDGRRRRPDIDYRFPPSGDIYNFPRGRGGGGDDDDDDDDDEDD